MYNDFRGSIRYTFFKEAATKSKNKYTYSVEALHTNNGCEYVSNELKQYLERDGITHECTPSYNPEQNGRVERQLRTIVESVRSMFNTREVPLDL